ncbi:MAG TPA: FxsA family protein [Acidimicrobiales bacterium]|nr:FxsA family protein [Acidimicrobiales bacterium]
MFSLGVLLFVGAEIASFVVVTEQIGFLWALTILLVVSALGPFVVRRVGVGVLANTQDRLARGELPTREVLDGLVVLLGGVMICVPGFVGDALGLLLMIGPIRRLVIRAAGYQLARRVPSIRIRSWRVTDAPSRTVGDDSLPPSQPPRPSLGAGEDDGP